MGRSGERSGGDSRIIDWPDATWKLVRETPREDSPRYFSAYSRKVCQPESKLLFDLDSHRLTLRGGNVRTPRTSGLIPSLLGVLRWEAGDMSGRHIVCSAVSAPGA
jgi:hypothetical protein